MKRLSVIRLSKFRSTRGDKDLRHQGLIPQELQVLLPERQVDETSHPKSKDLNQKKKR